MAFIDGLDIPDEFLELWNRILKLTAGGTGLGLIHYPARTNVQRNRTLFGASLFVRWQSLYDGFTSDRRHAWDLYWATLPFGSHSGSSGWPGSGYSAFVYVNAPRYREGLDLLLDPPVDNPELIINGAFDGGFAPDWGAIGASWVSPGFARLFSPGDLTQIVTLEADTTYLLEFDVDSDESRPLHILLQGEADEPPELDLMVGVEHVSEEIFNPADNGTESIGLTFEDGGYSGHLDIDNVSLKKVV